MTFQETRCREYARENNYGVVKVFGDLGLGREASRPGFEEMLDFLSQCPENSHVVIVDDIHVIARDIHVFLQLRAKLREAGSVLKSGWFPFDLAASDDFARKILAE